MSLSLIIGHMIDQETRLIFIVKWFVLQDPLFLVMTHLQIWTFQQVMIPLGISYLSMLASKFYSWRATSLFIELLSRTSIFFQYAISIIKIIQIEGVIFQNHDHTRDRSRENERERELSAWASFCHEIHNHSVFNQTILKSEHRWRRSWTHRVCTLGVQIPHDSLTEPCVCS